MNLMILGILTSMAVVVLMILGKLWAVLLFLVGFGLMVAHWAKIYKGTGYAPEAGTINGLNGQGRQQSEVYKDKNIPMNYEE